MYIVFCLQTILSSRPDGDCKVNNLRRRGQSLCDHQDTEEGRKAHVQQTVTDTEEQWRTVLQAAKQVEMAAEAQTAQETERRKMEVRKHSAIIPIPVMLNNAQFAKEEKVMCYPIGSLHKGTLKTEHQEFLLIL